MNASRLAVASVQWIEKLAFASIDKFAENGPLAFNAPPEDALNIGALNMETLDTMNAAALSTLSNHDTPESVRMRLISSQFGVYTPQPESAVVIGISGMGVVETPVDTLVPLTDFKNRRPKRTWWLPLNNLVRVLAKYGLTNMDA